VKVSSRVGHAHLVRTTGWLTHKDALDQAELFLARVCESEPESKRPFTQKGCRARDTWIAQGRAGIASRCCRLSLSTLLRFARQGSPRFAVAPDRRRPRALAESGSLSPEARTSTTCDGARFRSFVVEVVPGSTPKGRTMLVSSTG
jgi:hypothetical protein